MTSAPHLLWRIEWSRFLTSMLLQAAEYLTQISKIQHAYEYLVGFERQLMTDLSVERNLYSS